MVTSRFLGSMQAELNDFRQFEIWAPRFVIELFIDARIEIFAGGQKGPSNTERYQGRSYKDCGRHVIDLLLLTIFSYSTNTSMLTSVATEILPARLHVGGFGRCGSFIYWTCSY